MRKLIITLLALAFMAAGVWFSAPQLLRELLPHVAERSETQQFHDMLIDMKPDAAIQAGFVETMHEQTWSNEAFFSFFGIEIPLGQTEATLRAPIRVYYGVRPHAIHATGSAKGQLYLTIDRVEVLSVDADISRLEIRTDVGWARLDALSGAEARSRAKKAFEQSKYRAADNMLQSMQVTAYLREALKAIATQITGITDVRIDRLDMVQQH
ncbi:MAG: hypothetical protein K9M17_07060 [Mariprofundaceae bacterium]|nr:hypothetical protein [Mariprofundaceae bacterium]